MKRALMLCVVLAMTGVLGAEEFNLPPGKWWENERVAERIGLTDEQQRLIAGLVYEHALQMIDLNADVKRSELELAKLVGEGDFERDQIRAAFTAFQNARRALEIERFEMLLAVREVLTAEQWAMIQEIHKEMRRRRWSEERRPTGRGAPERYRDPPQERPPGGRSY